MRLKMHFGQIYQTLGQYHTKIIQMPACPDKTLFANNLKAILRMFTNDLNNSLGLPEEEPLRKALMQPAQQPLSQVLNEVAPNDDSQMHEEFDEKEILGLIRAGSGANDGRDAGTIAEQQRRLYEEIMRRQQQPNLDICGWCA